MCQSHGHHTILPRKSGELFSPLPLPGICICSLPFSKMVYLSSTEFFCQYKYPNLLQNSDPEEMRRRQKMILKQISCIITTLIPSFSAGRNQNQKKSKSELVEGTMELTGKSHLDSFGPSAIMEII
jgi:hypothetical protein